jgi:AcrR family transcriptional regulator
MSTVASDTKARARGRPRLFDEEAVLDELTALFWRQGYVHTSMANLVETSGVHKSSLYSTFGSKEELFATIMRRYLDNRVAILDEVVEQAEPSVDGIHAFLDYLYVDAVSGDSQHGCLLNNSAVELGGSAPGFKDFGATYRAAVRQRLRVLVNRAETEEAIDPAVTDQRADLFSMFLFGFGTTVRGGADEAELRRAIVAMHATVETWRT